MNIDKDKLAAVDALRGIAILMVILVHSMGLVPELPWPVARHTAFGWYGVQLFFIASAFTLMLSWHRHEASPTEKVRSFFIRRFLRIAPMYYLAAFAYLYLRPPPGGFDSEQFFLTLAFVNAWNPFWLGTSPGGWGVVPGGWSISVEFSFYFVFPLIASLITSTRRSLLFAVFAFLLMLAAWEAGEAYWSSVLDDTSLENFLFFWFPNQLVIFALGFVMFFVLASNNPLLDRSRQLIARHSLSMLWFVLGGILILGLLGITKTVSSEPPFLPTHFLVSILFVIGASALILCEKCPRLLVNPAIQSMGVVSFSAYLVHWAVLDLMHWLMDQLELSFSGYAAIAVFPVVYAVTVLLTYAVARLTYRFVETPFMDLAKRLTHRRTVRLRVGD